VQRVCQIAAAADMLLLLLAVCQVKDAFGLPLQSSQNVWWSLDLDPAYTGPSVRQVSRDSPRNPIRDVPGTTSAWLLCRSIADVDMLLTFLTDATSFLTVSSFVAWAT